MKKLAIRIAVAVPSFWTLIGIIVFILEREGGAQILRMIINGKAQPCLTSGGRAET